MRKVFSIQGQYPVVRAILRARGWVERRLPKPNQLCRRRRGDEEDDGNDADDSDDDDGEVGSKQTVFRNCNLLL